MTRMQDCSITPKKFPHATLFCHTPCTPVKDNLIYSGAVGKDDSHTQLHLEKGRMRDTTDVNP